MITSPVLPHHPLDLAGVVKIRLSMAASDALRAVGQHHLVLVAEADATAPAEVRDRMVLHCLPLTKERADDAAGVALGSHKATKIKTASSSTSMLRPDKAALPAQ